MTPWDLGLVDGMEKVANIAAFMKGKFGPKAARAQIKQLRRAAVLQRIGLYKGPDPKAALGEIESLLKTDPKQGISLLKSTASGIRIKSQQYGTRAAIGGGSAAAAGLAGQKIYEDMTPKIAASVLNAAFGSSRWAANKGAATARGIGQTTRSFKAPSPGKTGAEIMKKKDLGPALPKPPAQTRLSTPGAQVPQPDVAMTTKVPG